MHPPKTSLVICFFCSGYRSSFLEQRWYARMPGEWACVQPLKNRKRKLCSITQLPNPMMKGKSYWFLLLTDTTDCTASRLPLVTRRIIIFLLRELLLQQLRRKLYLHRGSKNSPRLHQYKQSETIIKLMMMALSLLGKLQHQKIYVRISSTNNH